MPLQLISKTSKASSLEISARSWCRPGAVMRTVILFVAVQLLFLTSPAPSQAQTIQYTQTKPDLALRSSMRVDPATLGLSIEVPIASYPARGGTSLPINLIYSSKQWRFNYYDTFYSGTGSPRTISHPKFSEWAKAGWTTGADLPIIEWTGHAQHFSDGNACGYCYDSYVRRIQVHMPGGASHELRVDDTPRNQPPAYEGIYYAVDSSNLRYEATANSEGILYLPDGSQYWLMPSTSGNHYIDRNGNTLTYDAANRRWADTQGRLLDLPINGSPEATTYTYQLPSTTSTPLSYSVRWSTLQNALTNPSDPLRYYSNMTGSYSETWDPRSPALFDGDGENRIYDPFILGRFDPMVLAEIILPNGKSYLFTYNVWGEITKVVYPTGAYERFAYDTVPGVGFLQWPYTQANRGVVDRWVSATGNSGDEVHWHYAAVASDFQLTVSTTEPDNTVTQRVMHAETSQGENNYGFSWALLGMQFEERKLATASGPMLRRKLTKWTSSGPMPLGWPDASRNPRAIKEVNILFEPGTSNALTSTTTMEYDNDLNVKATNQYDLISITNSSGETSPIDSIDAGALLRTDETTFLVNDGDLDSTTRTAYRNRNLLSLPTSTRVRKPAGNVPGEVVAKTRTTYDDYEATGNCDTVNHPLLTYDGTITHWTNPGSLRGLPTTTGVWLNTTNTYLQTHAQYDQFGNLVKSWDAKCNKSQVAYSGAYSYAYPTTSTTAVPDPLGLYGSTEVLSTTAAYHADSGLMTLQTDPNGQSTSYTYDGINRLATTTQPNGAHVTYSYSDTPNDLYVRVLTEQDASRSIETRKYFDGLGRGTREFLYDGTASTPWLVTDTYYDNMGRVSQISNTYRVSNPDSMVPVTCSQCTTNGYDALGRLHTVSTADGAQLETSYSLSTSGTLGMISTATDQALRKRRSLTDALGRLVRVDEPNKDTGSLDVGNAATFYTYNILGRLLRVDQDAQQRFFMHDSLGRLLRAKNPEQESFTPDADFASMTDASSGISNDQWSTGYIYDANGNLIKRKDARNIVTTFDYDGLNRNTTVDYSNTSTINPDITQKYDSAGNGKGRFSETYTGGNENVGVIVDHIRILSYDAMGRPLDLQQRFKTNSAWGDSTRTYSTHRTYDLSGHTKTQTYPSGHLVTYNYDQAGRLGDKDAQNVAFAGNLGGMDKIYSSGIIYSPMGGISKEQFGTDTPVFHKMAYNLRGQLAEIRTSTSYTGPSDTNWNRGAIFNQYSLQCSGAGCNASDNNGNLRKQEVLIPHDDLMAVSTSWYQQFEYDALNRLTEVHEHAGTSLLWRQSYSFDRYGNRSINLSGTTQGIGINSTQSAVVANTTTNRLYAPGETEQNHPLINYDAAGNQTRDYYSDPVFDYDRTYDAENRLKTSTATSGTNSIYTYNADGQRVRRAENGVETWQIYGMDGELLAEYAKDTANTSPQKEYGYRNGQLLITSDAPTGATNTVLPSLTAAPANNHPSNGVALSWSGLSGATNYRVERKDANNNWAKITSTASTTVTDNGAGGAGTAYLYKVCAADGQDNCTSGYSNVALASRFNFPTDPTLTTLVEDPSGANLTSIKAAHINELRTAINAVRILAGLSAAWIGTSVSVGDTIYKNDMQDLRDKLDDALRGLGIPTQAYQDSPLAGAPNGTLIKAVHIRQLRDRATRGHTPGAKLQPVAVTASASHSTPYGPSQAVDGNPGTLWSAGANAPQWIQLDLGQLANVSKIRLLVDQSPNGQTTHLVYGGSTANNLTLLGTFDGSTSLGQWLELDSTATGVRYVKVQTTASPSWVGWAEVEVYGVGVSSLAQVNWLVTDQLGTPRMIFDQTGSLAGVNRHDYLPFGEELVAGQGLRTSGVSGLGYDGDTTRQKFTSKERDIETGLDYFGARYYASISGRFTSPDPYSVVAEIQFEGDQEKAKHQLHLYVSEPQQWNRYAYGINNPLKYTDPTGEKIQLTGETAAERAAALQELRNVLGEERFKLVTVSADGRFVSLATENVSKMAAIGGNVDEKDLSTGMAEALNSADVLEFRVVESFTNSKGYKIDLNTYDYPGGLTVSGRDSSTGNVQVFVHPKAGAIATKAAKDRGGLRDRTSDGNDLVVTTDEVAAHELGHGVERMALQGRPSVGPKPAGPRWQTFENAVRSRNPNNPQRRARH